MQEAKQIEVCIELFVRYKQALKRVVSEDIPGKYGKEKTLLEAEARLENAFANLLALQPQNISDALIKTEFLVSEILQEAELTSYQAQALQKITDDLETLC